MSTTKDIKIMTMEELEAGLDHIFQSPKNVGVVELIVRRPNQGGREIIPEAELDPDEGLMGDNWKSRGSSRTDDGKAHVETQVTLMNARVIALLAGEKSRWALAGDQLYVDLDLSLENLPPGTHLQIGTAIIEVTDQPHTGCGRFMEWYGIDSVKFVNAPSRKHLRLRGINAKIIQPGFIKAGDKIEKHA